VDEVGRRVPTDPTVIELTTLGPRLAGALRREDVSPEAEEALELIESADLLVAASPVYRGSFTGLFKHLFDFVGQYALVGKPVLVAATGGGERHALILEHQLRPLFGFFQALTLPAGVYASDSDFLGGEVASPQVVARISKSVSGALPLIEQAARVQRSGYVSTW
jgi:FMN reductase